MHQIIKLKFLFLFSLQHNRICLIKSWTKVDEQIRIVQPRQPSVESCLSRNLSERWLFLVETHNSSKPFKISMKPSR
ncbi:hypothetical protein V6Z11_A06G152700 [Gossypium hirsutum]